VLNEYEIIMTLLYISCFVHYVEYDGLLFSLGFISDVYVAIFCCFMRSCRMFQWRYLPL